MVLGILETFFHTGRCLSLSISLLLPLALSLPLSGPLSLFCFRAHCLCFSFIVSFSLSPTEIIVIFFSQGKISLSLSLSLSLSGTPESQGRNLTLIVCCIVPYSRVPLSRNFHCPLLRLDGGSSTEGPMWGHPMPVLGALSPFLEPFCGHLSPKLDKVS